MPGYAAAITIVLLILLLIIGAGVVSLLGMTRIRIEPIDESAARELTLVHKEHVEWAEANGFEHLGYFSIRAPANPSGLAEVWRLPDVPTYFCLYVVAGKALTDRVTILENNCGLTTGSSASATFLPAKPGSFLQAFTNRSLDELWERHLEGEAFVVERLGKMPGRIDEPVHELMMRACREQIAHFRSNPLWPIRILTRFLGQPLNVNKPITDRYAHLTRDAR